MSISDCGGWKLPGHVSDRRRTMHRTATVDVRLYLAEAYNTG
jgi:hypothetical protein